MNSSDTSLPRRGSSQLPKHPAGSTAAREQREGLAGLVERVTFHNPDNGFCVLRIKARGARDLITVVGHAATISAGEFVQVSGVSTNETKSA